MAEANHTTGQSSGAFSVPTSLESADPVESGRLREDFEEAYLTVENFWKRRMSPLPSSLPTNHPIVKCFIMEWTTVHSTPRDLWKCEREGIPGLSVDDSVVREFISAWSDRHSKP